MPAACRRRRALTSALIDVFERWGYAPVMTPLVEYYDVLGRGLTEADRRTCVRFIEAGGGDVVALRSDLTPQIARMVAQRAGGELDAGVARRLSYAADVVRQETGQRPGTQLPGEGSGRSNGTEQHQAGVELIGDPDPAADAELVALCHASLRAVGLDDFRVDVAHTSIGNGVLESLGLPATATQRLRALLGHKDRGGIAELLAEHAVSSAVADAAVQLCDLFGPPAVLQRARAGLRGAGAGVQIGLDRLEAVFACLQVDDPDAWSRLTVDLGEVRGFDYYTGIRMRVWAAGVGRPVARGGRYDDLLGRYGWSAPAVGFAIDLDALEAALEHAGRAPQGRPDAASHLVAVAVSTGPTPHALRMRAAAVARAARSRGQRAWVVSGVTLERAQALAQAAGAAAMSFVDSDDTVVEYARTAEGWAPTLDAAAASTSSPREEQP